MSSDKPLTKLAFACLAISLAMAAALPAQAAKRADAPDGCGQSRNRYGPFDYRTAAPQQRSIVEEAHFTRGVESLTRGETGPFGGDIGYTLGVFPNHARAMISMERLSEREKADQPKGAEMTVDCYFARGMEFAPDDLVFRMLYVSHLTRRNRLEEAQRFLAYVVTQAGDSPLTHFNAGMLYFDMKDYDKALAQAHRAMGMGLTRTDLQKRLESVGRWQEPPAEPAEAASAASAAEPASQPSR
ncbi:ABC transporter permease [Roseateles sp. NT4]|uniref:ABC transporter permease n=1 Tax=Roseateles sp. NT4 TaxID=3453715 RepID=UPI003EEB8620